MATRTEKRKAVPQDTAENVSPSLASPIIADSMKLGELEVLVPGSSRSMSSSGRP